MTRRWTMLLASTCAACGPQPFMVVLDGSTQEPVRGSYLTIREQGGGCFEMAVRPTVGVRGALEFGLWRWNSGQGVCEDVDPYTQLCRLPPASTSELLRMFRFDVGEVRTVGTCAAIQPMPAVVNDPIYAQRPGCGEDPLSVDLHRGGLTDVLGPPPGMPRDLWEELKATTIVFLSEGDSALGCTERPSE